ncbi:hypothetical protein CN947_29025 [Bacillus cereus]|nr:hypothetical protein CN947_29025 [Bacillus cereus]
MGDLNQDELYVNLKHQKEFHYKEVKKSIINFLILGTIIYFYTVLVNWSDMSSWIILFIKFAMLVTLKVFFFFHFQKYEITSSKKERNKAV